MSVTADSKKIILVELDIGQQQSVWFNYSAFTWYVDFDAVYDRIDAEFLNGVGAQDIDSVGSVSSDAAALRLAASLSAVQAEENTFYWDAGSRRVYVHLVDGDEPSLHRIVLGVVYGVANHGGVYGGTLYESRLLSAPRIGKSRDPLFWGRISFDGGTVSIDNTDGRFDSMAEDQDVFGNSARILLGFDDEDRDEFRQIYTGTIGAVRVGTDVLEVDIVDPRRYLATRVPDQVFRVADYADLKDSNEGKSIPIGYGVLRNVPAICTNEAEDPAPANYCFKLLEMSHHDAIGEITTVYVDGVAKAPASTDLAEATFTLAAANYSPGQRVTVDCKGYEDGEGNLIGNALDVIADILQQWLGIPYSASAYDQGAWAAARLLAPEVGYFADKPTEVSEIIEDIASTARGLFLVDAHGRFSFRIPNEAAYPVQEIEGHELLEAPSMEYAPEETLGVVQVGYCRDWSSGESLYLRDDSLRAEVLERYKIAPERTFETLLPDAAAAQEFADAVLASGGRVARQFSLRLKLSAVQRELGDIIHVTLTRRDGDAFIGTMKAEVIGVEYDLIAAEQLLRLRVIEILPPPGAYVEGEFYGDSFYGDSTYGTSGNLT